MCVCVYFVHVVVLVLVQKVKFTLMLKITNFVVVNIDNLKLICNCLQSFSNRWFIVERLTRFTSKFHNTFANKCTLLTQWLCGILNMIWWCNNTNRLACGFVRDRHVWRILDMSLLSCWYLLLIRTSSKNKHSVVWMTKNGFWGLLLTFYFFIYFWLANR